MTKMTNQFRGVDLHAPVRDVRYFSTTSSFIELVCRVSRAIKSNIFLLALGFFATTFYGIVIELLTFP